MLLAFIFKRFARAIHRALLYRLAAYCDFDRRPCFSESCESPRATIGASNEVVLRAEESCYSLASLLLPVSTVVVGFRIADTEVRGGY